MEDKKCLHCGGSLTERIALARGNVKARIKYCSEPCRFLDNHPKRLKALKERYASDPAFRKTQGEYRKNRRKQFYQENPFWRIEKERDLPNGTIQQLIDVQKGKCKICRRTFVFGDNNSPLKPCYDHCHHTKVFRAMLCGDCNRIEGLVRLAGGVKVARSLLEYMEDHVLFYGPTKGDVHFPD